MEAGWFGGWVVFSFFGKSVRVFIGWVVWRLDSLEARWFGDWVVLEVIEIVGGQFR